MGKQRRVQIISEDGLGRNTQCKDIDTSEEIPRIFRIELTLDIRDKEKPYWQGRLYTHMPSIDVVGEMKMLPPLCPCCQQMVPEELLNFQRVQQEIEELIPRIGTIADDEFEEEGV